MFSVPPFLHNRIRVLIVLSPLPAGAVAAVMVKKLALWATCGAPFAPGDIEIGAPLGGLSVALLVLLLIRSARVWAGSPSRFGFALKVAPFLALGGVLLGLYANHGR